MRKSVTGPDELRFAIALQTGIQIVDGIECHCGKIFDKLGLHELSCC